MKFIIEFFGIIRRIIIKKNWFITISLTILFLLAVITPSFAAVTHNWVDGEYQYNGTLSYNGDLTRTKVTDVSVMHTNGTPSVICPNSEFTVRQGSENGHRAVYEPLLREAGFTNTDSFYVDANGSVMVPSGAQSREYFLTVEFPGSRVSIQVTTLIVDEDGNTALHNRESKTSDYTPRRYAGYTSYTS